MLKITGLDKLTRDLNEAQTAMQEVDRDLGQVSFNPSDPEDIEAAIQEMEEMIDGRLGSYAGNPVVGPMITAMKERYRDAIVEKAAEARVGGDRAE